MKATFLAFQYPNGRLELCEGGVFSDAPRGEYVGNTLEHGEAERLRLNTERPANQAGYYVTLDSAIGVTADETVWESLEEWQRAEFQLSGSADLADLAASESPHAADLARNLAALRRGEPSAFAAVVASASLLESNAARIAGRYLESFAESRKPADLAGVFDALRELERQACEKAGEARDATAALHSLQSVNAANAEARAKAERESAAYREQRDPEGARAEKAGRQLAEYRSLMSALPAGMARAYPAAFPLLRAYLADVESDG